MIREFELRVAEVLGERLAAPLHGRVWAAQAAGAAGAQPRVVLGAVAVVPDDAFLRAGPRTEVVPGATPPRRVLPLRCDLELRVEPGDDGDRGDQVAAVGALLDALGDPGLLPALAAAPGTDPGFLVDTLAATGAAAPLDPAPPAAVTATATGLFWPVGATGETGVQITEIRVRAGALPLAVRLPVDAFVAGGPPGDVELRLAATGTLAVTGGGATTRPFGALALRLTAPGGGPGAGTLSGGAAGAQPGERLVDLVEGAASVTYMPPAAPARDMLVVAFDGGMELGRLAIAIGAG